ncbi:MAG: ATP-binding cassette domain-containing protein [Bacteroidales bacterium]|nr:ATP-binding cassette domain-containing protein [Bacteroidales bacterium]
MSLLVAEEVVKQYSNHLALDRLNMSVPNKSIYGLLGPNGAGKTTLLRIINQITAPDSGRVLLDGAKLGPHSLTKIGYLPEERGLYKKMKVGEQAIYLARLKGLSRHEAIRRLRYWFKKLEIIEWWDKKVEELSKGMQQKIQFVTTVLHEPELLIFDEPFSGFDPINARTLKEEILSLRDKGATIIFSTHNMESVEELCDHITLIDRARSILEGNIETIRNQWAGNEYIVRYSGDPEMKENALFNLLETRRENGYTDIRFNAKENMQVNDIIKEVISKGEMVSFNPALPSMNEIFIRVVEANKEQKSK